MRLKYIIGPKSRKFCSFGLIFLEMFKKCLHVKSASMSNLYYCHVSNEYYCHVQCLVIYIQFNL